MITEAHCKEKLNESFVKAIGSIAGLKVEFPNADYGVDGYFRDVIHRESDGKMCETGINLDYQLKATINWELEGDHIVYDLDVKNYNDLVENYNDSNFHSPLILILLCLPKEKVSWLEINAKNLILRNCCYWFCVDGSHKHSKNSKSVRIRIPSSNLLNPYAISELMRIANRIYPPKLPPTL